MRLAPVERPGNLFLKIAYYISKQKFGKVLMVFKTIYARSTPVLLATIKIIRTENKLSIPKNLRLLIRYYTSHLNECPFCSNINSYSLRKESKAFPEWKEFLNFRENDKFSSREKALLAYLEEVNFTKTSSDKVFEGLKQYFSEKEIVEITWLNATENYFNLMAKPLQIPSDNLQVGSDQNEWNGNDLSS